MTDPRRMHLVDAATGGASPTRTLSEINFNDIYFRPGQPPRVRDPDPSFGEAKGRLEAVPRSFYEDAQALLAATVSESRARGNAAEFNVQHGGVSYRAARVSFGQESHEGWCLRRLAPAPPALNRLGLPVDLALALDGLAHESGLLIISGSFSSGKSTTASSVFSHWLQRYGDVGVTLEDPIETSIPQPPDSDGLCYQVEVEGEGFAEAIRPRADGRPATSTSARSGPRKRPPSCCRSPSAGRS
jgi:twitching motility protein PilT